MVSPSSSVVNVVFLLSSESVVGGVGSFSDATLGRDGVDCVGGRDMKMGCVAVALGTRRHSVRGD